MRTIFVFQLAQKTETTSAVNVLTLICSFLVSRANTPEQNNEVIQNYTYWESHSLRYAVHELDYTNYILKSFFTCSFGYIQLPLIRKECKYGNSNVISIVFIPVREFSIEKWKQVVAE